ncbi:uncharacterized protein [Typha angustifolia]|uniref:uncharacterized protein isoform X1 n=1 Tax=Typha angustifolia TaxID=59011 RepID=UPI003C2D5A5D
MMIEASAQNDLGRTIKEEAKFRKRSRDLVWDKRGLYANALGMPKKKVAGESVKRARIANWTRTLDAALVRILKQEYFEGNFVNGLFTKSAWIRIVAAFNAKTRLNLNKGHLQNRLKVLKDIFRLYNDVATMSGWEWDPVRNLPKPEDPSSWERIVVINPQFAKCRDKPFPAYPILKLFFVKDTSNQSQMDAMAVDLSDIGEDSSSSHSLSEKNASNEKQKDRTAPVASNNKGNDASASDDVSSSGLSERTFVVSRALEELVEIGRRQQEIASELLNQEIAFRPKSYSIEQCISKLKSLRNISSEAFLAACEAFQDKHDRCVFMNLKGPVLRAWIDRKFAMHSIYHQPIQPIQQRPPHGAPCPPSQECSYSSGV